MMFNPMQIIQAARGGTNPNQLMMQLTQTNPLFKQAAQIMSGKTPDQIRDMVMQEARRRGIDLNQMMRQMGIQPHQ
jgi:hypothetical protein